MIHFTCFFAQWRTSRIVTLWNWGTCWFAHTCTTWKTWPATSTMRTTELSAYRRWPGVWKKTPERVFGNNSDNCRGYRFQSDLPASPLLLFFSSLLFFFLSLVNWLRTTVWRVPSPSCRSPPRMWRPRNSSKWKMRRYESTSYTLLID